MLSTPLLVVSSALAPDLGPARVVFVDSVQGVTGSGRLGTVGMMKIYEIAPIHTDGASSLKLQWN